MNLMSKSTISMTILKFANCTRLPGRVNHPQIAGCAAVSTKVVDMQPAEVICAIKVLLWSVQRLFCPGFRWISP